MARSTKVLQRERLQSKFSACQGSHSRCILCHERMKDWQSHPGQWKDTVPPAVGPIVLSLNFCGVRKAALEED